MKLRRPQINKRALKRSFLTSIGRLIGVGLAAGSGTLIHQLVGDGFNGWITAFSMALGSFLLIWFTEYERDIE